MVDERSILLAQLQALGQELQRSEELIGAPQIAGTLRTRVQARFELLIHQQRQAVQDLARDIPTAQSLETYWMSLHAIREQCGGVFRECLAFLEGALVRKAGFDDGLCEIADALLDEINRRADSRWDRFTIVADGEFFADMAEIIRLRFPESSIWSLPVAAHEFGHFLGPALEVHTADGRSRHPFQELLERARQQDARAGSFLHEHFADVFATYAVGPAYPFACILLRFDPTMAHRDGSQHPSNAKRAYLILKVLEKMDAGNGVVRQFRDIIEQLRTAWDRMLVAAAQPSDLDPQVVLALDALLDELWMLLNSYLPPKLRYAGWLRAQQLAEELAPGKQAAPKFQAGDKLVDAINAAWLCRFRHWNDSGAALQHIAARALLLCRGLIQ